MTNEADIQTILKVLQVTEETNYQQNFELLKEKINELIQSDFSRLLHLLYTVDVDENQLKKALQKSSGTDASTIIATLLVTREIEKRALKKSLHRKNENIPDNEKW